MKKEELIAMGVDEETADKIIKQFEAEMTKASDGLNAQKGLTDSYLKELSSLREKYKDVDVDALRQESDTWKQRYETEMGAKEDAVNKAKHDILLSNLLDGMSFTSDFAKKGVEDALRKKNLKVTKDNKFDGIEDIITSLKEEYSDAFAEEDTDDEGDEDVVTTTKTQPNKKKVKNITGKVKGRKKEKSVDEYLDSIYKDNPYYTR